MLCRLVWCCTVHTCVCVYECVCFQISWGGFLLSALLEAYNTAICRSTRHFPIFTGTRFECVPNFFLRLPNGPLAQSPGFAAVHAPCPCDYGGMWVIVAQADGLMGFNTGAFFFFFIQDGWEGGRGSSRQVVTWQRAKRSDRYYSAHTDVMIP